MALSAGPSSIATSHADASARDPSSRALEELGDIALLSSQAVRALERVLIDERGVPGILLMKRAGQAVFERVLAARARSLCVYCGSGNNAGDGFVIAALAQAAGLSVQVICVGDVAKLPADGARAHAWALAEQVPMHAWVPGDAAANAAVNEWAATADVLVDALLGTGFAGAPRAAYAEAIDSMNALARPVIAVDLPSGLTADNGTAPGAVVRADETVTFIGIKPGLLTGRGPEFCGALRLADLAAPADLLAAANEHVARAHWSPALALPPRRRDAHKGDSGHVLILGGASGMGGAALLAGEAAMRTGAGLVSIGCAPEHTPAMLARRPELMPRGIGTEADVIAVLARASVIAVGPGLGQDAFGRMLLTAALSAGRPLVLDADALNLLASGFAPWPADAVLTPHPAEAARILGVSTAEVQQDRLGAARALVARTGAVVVLKGAGSLIADAERVRICTDGNPGMAVGGMGDVLAGVVAALRAQGCAAFEAALRGVCLHARAGDEAVREGERGLLAADLFPHLRRLCNGVPDARAKVAP